MGWKVGGAEGGWGLHFSHISAISGGGKGKVLPVELASGLECVEITELVAMDENGTFLKR